MDLYVAKVHTGYPISYMRLKMHLCNRTGAGRWRLRSDRRDSQSSAAGAP